MLGLFIVAVIGIIAIWIPEGTAKPASELPQKISTKLDRLWEVAQEAINDRKFLRAEKALLTILRVDERNATAYNRLGILYAKQKAFSDAIECFEIAQSLEPSASSLHNVGLIYLETGNYEKAALAFEQAIDMEGDLATRHIAYAKVLEKLGHTKRMITALERAVELEPMPSTYNILADAYDTNGQAQLAAEMRQKSAKMIGVQDARQIANQPRRVVM